MVPVQVTRGGVRIDVAFAGMICMGVLQVNIRVPHDAPSGEAVELVVSGGSHASQQAATVAIR